MKIFFDMDGTIANLYGINNWLQYIINEETFPYDNAKGMDLNRIAKELNRLTKQGHEIGIISWLAKNSTASYDEKVINSKRKWLKKHMKSVKFSEIHIVPYGTDKSQFGDENSILFDDELNNRKMWKGKAYDEQHIIEILRGLN